MPDKEKQGLQPIDLNDLSLQTEELGEDFNAEAEAFGFPPPPDDGIHRVRLGYGTNRVQQGFSEKQNKHFIMFHLQLNPVDEKGWAVFDRPSTMVFGSGTNRVAGIIKAVTGQPAKARDTVSLAKELDALVRAERIVKVETQWVASCNHGEDGAKYQTIKRGQAKFPRAKKSVNGSGGYVPEIECPKCRAIVNAQANVVKYLNDGGADAGQSQAASASVDVDENPFAG